MNDILSHLDRKACNFTEWLKFQKSRIPLPETTEEIYIYASRVYAYKELLHKIQKCPNTRIGRLLELEIKIFDKESTIEHDRPFNCYVIAKEEAQWILDEIIVGGGWIS